MPEAKVIVLDTSVNYHTHLLNVYLWSATSFKLEACGSWSSMMVVMEWQRMLGPPSTFML